MPAPTINGLQAASAEAGDAFAVVFATAPRNASTARLLNAALHINISVPNTDPPIVSAKPSRRPLSETVPLLSAHALSGGPLFITLDDLDHAARASVLENSLTVATSISGVLLLNIRFSDLARPCSSGVQQLMAAVERSLALRVSGLASPLPTKRLFCVVVRDYESDQITEEELQRVLSDQLTTAYQEIELPSGFSATHFTDLFDLHVSALPSEKHLPAQYATAVNSLGDVLRKANHEYTDAGLTPNRLSDDIIRIRTALSDESDSDLPEERELTASFTCNAIAQGVFDKYRNAAKQWKATVDAGRVIRNFGFENDRLIEETLKVYDRDASVYKSTRAFARKREELQSRLLTDSYALFAKQILKVRENAYQVFRAKLARIRITDKVETNVKGAVKEAELFFIKNGEALRSKMGNWRFDNERHELVNHMRDDATERLQLARLQGNYVPPIRAPIAFAFHTLLLAPFGKDSRLQTPYAEEMKQTYDPDKVKQAHIMRSRPYRRSGNVSFGKKDEIGPDFTKQYAPLFEDDPTDDS